MRPDWFRCEKCLFGMMVKDEDGDGFNIDCNISSSTDCKKHTDFCKEWTCANCWCSWDSCTYSKDEDDFRGIYDDHNKCEPVRFKGQHPLQGL